MKRNILIFPIFLFFIVSTVFAQKKDQIVIGTKHFIESKILSEKREYWISLPNSYAEHNQSYKEYPILILLDGHVHFKAVSSMVNYRSSGNSDKREIPEMIVVGVLNVNRERDFTPDKIVTKRKNKTGGGDNFLNFLQTELIPTIEKDYRTIPYRILAGHSLGGLITTHAYLQENISFHSFISIDPSFGSWDESVINQKLKNVNEQIFERPLFIASANWDSLRNIRNKDRHSKFHETLRNKSNNKLNCQLKYYENKNHSSVPFPAIYDGLSFIFKGYNLSYREVNNIDQLTKHYLGISSRISFNFNPPEELVNRIGYHLIRSKNIEDKNQALKFFNLNAKNYPDSYNVFDSLGEAQFLMQFNDLAIKSYEKSLVLNPENENAKKMIDKIENQQ